MSAQDNGGPAFPSHGSMGEVTHEGMSLRDYLAAKAMQAGLAGATIPGLDVGSQDAVAAVRRAVKAFYLIADIMVQERQQ